MRISTLLSSLIIVISTINIQAQTEKWFDEELIGSIVLLEKKVNNEFISHGTGFLLYNYDKQDNPILVTCAHILKGKEIYVVICADSEFVKLSQKRSKKSIQIDESLWFSNGYQLRLQIKLQEGVTFATHPTKSIDIAALPIGLGTIGVVDSAYGKMKITKTSMIPKSRIHNKKDCGLGDEVYFVGFPFGIGTGDILNPLVRSGSIAWLSTKHKWFLLDAFSNPGNSGSPIFTKKNLFSPNSFLTGMIVGHLQEPIAEIKSKGGCSKDEIIINQNIGLARCVWVDEIMTVVKLAKKLNKK